jgi:predicted ferric reductase
MEYGPNPMLRQNSGPALMKGIWAAMAVAIVIVILRVIAKIKIRHFRVDDILMIVALVRTRSAAPSRPCQDS